MGHDHPEEEQPFFIHTYSDVQYIFIVQITYALIHICRGTLTDIPLPKP